MEENKEPLVIEDENELTGGNGPENGANLPLAKNGIDCINVIENFGFNLGNAVKCLWMADDEGGSLENLKDAQFFIKREMRKRRKEGS